MKRRAGGRRMRCRATRCYRRPRSLEGTRGRRSSRASRLERRPRVAGRRGQGASQGFSPSPRYPRRVPASPLRRRRAPGTRPRG
ncbi:hypothetical protein ACFPRL_31190 [Pseudoclavibacter helvolus]